MSGNPTGSNVVPMPHAPAPAPASYPLQPPMPFPMWGGGGSLPWGPGCCPPGGMDALLKCYCDVQAATAFICSVMVQCIQTNPAVTEAIIAAITASGSNVPLLGVTNGSNAQPGQVGEAIFLGASMQIAPGTNTNVLTLGQLSAGDWDCEASTEFVASLDYCSIALNPLPPGAEGNSNQVFGSMQAEQVMVTPVFRISSAAPSLIAFTVTTTNPGSAGAMILTLFARRMR